MLAILFLSGCASKVQLHQPSSFQEVAVAAFDTSSLDLVFWGKTKNVQLPKMTLQVKMVDKSGQPVWNDKVSVTSETPVVVDETWLFGIKHKTQEHGPALTDLLQQAVDELVRETYELHK
jgi:hypothetical protein